MKNDEIMGTVTISKKALAQISAKTALDCEGVAMLTDRSKKDELSRFLNGGVKGVYITKVQGGIAVEIYIICSYGADVPSIRKQIADGIAGALGEIGIKIKGVSVCVTGVQEV
ncbi:MAG: Asp23/Gls24 family envelope stress response protein [Clostridiales bacterium]|nr:Asp23/Gls24 family envelope stress response protein [Clostridiales bacterium]